MIEWKKCVVDDLPSLRRIGVETFVESFGGENTAENMAGYLADAFAPAKLEKEMNNPASVFFLALENGDPVGYLKLNLPAAHTVPQEGESVEVERIYLLKKFHGSGYGQALMEKAVEFARGARAKCLWLGVWENNPRAIRFYEKNGFRRFGEHIFIIGSDEQIDHLMRKDLETGTSPWTGAEP